jgi:hypothetical protein
MITLRKRTKNGDLVTRTSNVDEARKLKADGWRPCSKKVWSRASPATKKDLSGPSKNIRIDSVGGRKERPVGKTFLLSRHMPTGKKYD